MNECKECQHLRDDYEELESRMLIMRDRLREELFKPEEPPKYWLLFLGLFLGYLIGVVVS